MSLALYFIVYFFLAFVWRTALVYKRTGVNPLVLPSSDNVHGYVGRAFKAAIAGCGVLVGLNAHPSTAYWLSSISFLDVPALNIIGWALLVVSLLWILVAQAQMGNSWRIGVDPKLTALVQRGLFRFSRNPIFLSLRITLLGLFLVTPSAASLAILVASELLIQVQVRLEESHLAELHGEQYKVYQAAVRRWL